jgi:hypothetical protein
MPNMALGTYTFTSNPSEMSVITPMRHTASVKTYSSVAFFSWGTDIVGVTLSLHFNFMTVAQYDSLLALLEADAQLVFDPQDGSGSTYNVEMVNLQGDYFIYLGTGYRQNVVLDLLVLSEVA